MSPVIFGMAIFGIVIIILLTIVAIKDYTKNKLNVGDKFIFSHAHREGVNFDGVEFEITEKLENHHFRFVCIKGKVLSTGEDMVYETILPKYVINELYIRISKGKN